MTRKIRQMLAYSAQEIISTTDGKISIQQISKGEKFKESDFILLGKCLFDRRYCTDCASLLLVQVYYQYSVPRLQVTVSSSKLEGKKEEIC